MSDVGLVEVLRLYVRLRTMHKGREGCIILRLSLEELWLDILGRGFNAIELLRLGVQGEVQF